MLQLQSTGWRLSQVPFVCASGTHASGDWVVFLREIILSAPVLFGWLEHRVPVWADGTA